MQKRFALFGGILLVVLGFLAYNALFVVHQTQQALVLQFGAIKRVVQEPGLNVKLPFIQNVLFFDRRVLNLDPPPLTVVLSDQRRLIVDVFVRYRITDPVRFYETVNNETQLRDRFAPIVNNQVRSVLGEVTLTSVLSEERDEIMQQIRRSVNAAVRQATVEAGIDTTVVGATAETEGEPAEEEVQLTDTSQPAERRRRGLGIDVVDVRIGRADLSSDVSRSVYERMRAERERDAAEFRAQGQEQFQRITASADREATVIRAEAQRDSDILRGEGEGERTRLLNDAFGQDAEFFDFYRSMQAYTDAIRGENSMIVMPPDNDFFRFFNQLPAGVMNAERNPEQRAQSRPVSPGGTGSLAAEPPAQ
ncbi:protease modulator HflC [Algihabitans albus]|uniref:protease modulator HflC n=1 Tax=Algihabitans albus TaxID=2164067 RepID=UPI000E5D3F27|nr:protease modulator HflC [Algihabitans albus]